MRRRNLITYLVFALLMGANFCFWLQSRHVQAGWANVPPAPKERDAGALALGDNQLAYRHIGVMLQNLGSEGSHNAALREYDYKKLQDWFFLEDSMDSTSNFMPFLAAYYYGAVPDKKKLNYVIDYLRVIGSRPEGEKWRWLAHAVYLARHQQNNLDQALSLAYELAAVENPDMAPWARQMPAFILEAKGDKETAYTIMLNILISSAEKLHPNEVNYMKDYICNTLLEEEESRQHPLCSEQ